MIWDTLRSWLTGIIAAGIVLSVLYALLPKGRWRPIARAAGGVALLLVILRPVVDMDMGAFALSYDDYEREIQALTEEYRQSASRELTSLIEEKTAAYIASKGAELGLDCTAQVETELREGVPYPAAAKLDIDRDPALAAWMASELDIGEDRQHWAVPEAEVDG